MMCCLKIDENRKILKFLFATTFFFLGVGLIIAECFVFGPFWDFESCLWNRIAILLDVIFGVVIIIVFISVCNE